MPATKKRSAKRSLDFGDEEKQKEGVDGVVDLTASSPASTPQKKNKKRDLKAFFSSPVASTTAASDSAAVVTPPDAKRAKTKDEKKKEGEYVPVYIHKNLSYAQEGKSELDPTTQTVYNLVKEHFVIPAGFENNRSYGPISGVCFEERVITCYCNNLLKPNDENGEAIEICTHCAEIGHKRDDCSELI